MTTEVRTPFGAATTIELSSDGLYRKQVLRFGTINYTDRRGQQRKITFDRKYGEDLVRAFKDGAYDQVPFQLADADNRHTNDPTRTAGEVVALSLSPDGSGVDGVLRLSPKGREVVMSNPKLGVSSRILENAELGGRIYPRALQHVLGTVDPQVRGMRPWEKVNSVDLAAGSVAEAVDLSTATYERSAGMPEQNGDKVTLELSTAQRDRIMEMLEEDESLDALAEQLEAAGIDLNDPNPDDDDEGDEDEDSAGDDVELSSLTGEAVELANAQISTLGSQVLELTNRLAVQRMEAEEAEFRRQGLAPAIIEAARPLLAVTPGVIELSNGPTGQSVDPGEVVREVLETVVELARSGHLMVEQDEVGDLRGTDRVENERAALLSDWASYGD